eukprot:233836-Chlamydomonas_euryale.AAC.4
MRGACCGRRGGGDGRAPHASTCCGRRGGGDGRAPHARGMLRQKGGGAADGTAVSSAASHMDTPHTWTLGPSSHLDTWTLFTLGH